MKNLLSLSLVTIVYLCFHQIHAQSILKLSNSPSGGDDIVCPVEGVNYEVINLPSHLQGCNINWTATNGHVTVDPYDIRKVTVNWNDTPGAIGTLKATFVSCGNSNYNNTVESFSELILSVNNESWGFYTNNVNIDYCSTQNIQLTVPKMYIRGTGGINQPPLEEVDYKWTLPGGWKDVSSGQSGVVFTNANYIYIKPIGCALPGIVNVEGIINNDCGSAAASQPATITLNGVSPVLTIGPEPGYAGSTACKTDPVTFTATMNVALGCVNNYTWTFPSGWSWLNPSTGLYESSPVNTASNTIQLTPSGDASDQGAVKVSANFDCGSSISSGNYNVSYIQPVITGSNLVCSSANYAVQNITGTSVSWSSSNTNIATINSSGILTRVNGASGEVIVTATFPCAAEPVNKTVWVGKPSIYVPGLQDPFETPPMQFCQTYYYETQNYHEVTGKGFIGSLQYDWNVMTNNFGYYTQGNKMYIQPHTLGTIVFVVKVQNSCGWSNNSFVQYEVVDCDNNNFNSQYQVYPNPTSGELNIGNVSVTRKNNSHNNGIQVAKLNSLANYKVYNNRGDQVLSGHFEKSHQLDVSTLKKGTYILVINSEGVEESHRIIVK